MRRLPVGTSDESLRLRDGRNLKEEKGRKDPARQAGPTGWTSFSFQWTVSGGPGNRVDILPLGRLKHPGGSSTLLSRTPRRKSQSAPDDGWSETGYSADRHLAGRGTAGFVPLRSLRNHAGSITGTCGRSGETQRPPKLHFRRHALRFKRRRRSRSHWRTRRISQRLRNARPFGNALWTVRVSGSLLPLVNLSGEIRRNDRNSAYVLKR